MAGLNFLKHWIAEVDQTNNSVRVDNKKKGTYLRISQARKLLEKYNVEYNILTVLTNELAKYPVQVWNHLCKENIHYRTGIMGERRKSLVQNIDMAPTLLKYFGMKPTKDMLGHDLAFAKSFCGSLGQYMLRYIYDITEQKMYSLEEIPFA